MFDTLVENEKIGVSKVLTVDEAKQKKGVIGEQATKLEQEIASKQNVLFKDIYSVVFGWRVQEDKSRKLVSKMPNGKILFPDRTENMEEVEPGTPYICLVYEREREAFAKIICEEHQPKIFVPSSRIPHMVWRDESGKIRRKAPYGNSFEERMISAIKEMEKLGFMSIKIVFRKNQI
jgi:hypothetical protein